MRIHAIGFDFLKPYCEEYAEFVEDPAQADFVLSMNNAGGPGFAVIGMARATADKYGKPFCWWTIEDPNSHLAYLPQAKKADYVFTSDKALIPQYRQAVGHDRVFWLPLAASESIHRPLPLADDAADFVFSGNWYPYGARKWGDQTVILPLARAGYSMAIFSYEEPPYPELKAFWRGGTSCYTTAEQYTHGKVVLGANCQRSGMDGIAKTYMTSMRTFEALACGKAFLAPHSDAYEALGFHQGYHMGVIIDPGAALCWGEHSIRNDKCLSDAAVEMAEAGRAFVVANHTYGHRLRRIAAAIVAKAEPEDL